MANKNLNRARRSKNDEFYTQFSDIENELKHYENCFEGKTVYCNCDDPRESNFFQYFLTNFEKLGLKKLIASGYKKQHINLFNKHKPERAVYSIYEGGGKVNINKLKGDGDFRSHESIQFLKQADIVVTNPPFSLFREFVAQLTKYDKKFLIIGNMNAITYKNIFPLIREGKIWLGYGEVRYFINKHYEVYSIANNHKEGMLQVLNARWFTNLGVRQQPPELVLHKKYNPAEYPSYDNFKAINVDKIKDIPMDYEGIMGVPITFLDKYNSEQFKIVGLTCKDNQNMDGGCWMGGIKSKAVLNGKKIYRRILIKNKKLS